MSQVVDRLQSEPSPRGGAPSPVAANFWGTRLGRGLGIGFGVMTQLVFLWTVVQLFLFLRYGGSQPSNTAGLWVDLAFAIAFAVPHSLLLVPSIQQRIKKSLPAGLLGCVHCLVTCTSLLVMFHYWGVSRVVLWELHGGWQTLVLVGFYGSWVGLFYSLYLTGLGYQTGLTQWWYWLIRENPPRREFVVKGAYRWMRHPVYMSFLGLIWFTPHMSLDHAILTGVWTAYIYAGSYFKDRRLIRFIGQPYLEYAARIPGLPIIGFGSLRRMR